MSRYKLLDKLGIKIEETKETVQLYHRYKENDTDTITKWWVNAYDVEQNLKKVYEQDSTAVKGRKYVLKLEKENRKLKGQIAQIKHALKRQL